MKATGVIRKMDSLGRLVVPKEFRRTMGADDGTEFEIYTDGVDTICFKKVAPTKEEIDWEKLSNIVECILGKDAEFALYNANDILQIFVGDYSFGGHCYSIANGKAFLSTPPTKEADTAADVLSTLLQ